METAHDIISTHFTNWGDAGGAHDGFASFAWDVLDETRTALADGSGEQFDLLASDVAYSVNLYQPINGYDAPKDVTEAQAAAWILEERDGLISAVDAAIALRDD